MSDFQMPARIWVGYNTGWADCEMRGDTAYVKADIAERMAEALEQFTCATVTPNGQIIGLMREDFERARAALSAFKDSAKDGSAS